MANLSQSLSTNGASSSTSAQNNAANKDCKMASAEQLVLELCNPDLRENALLELSKKRELFQDLATLLWNSFGTMASLLQVHRVLNILGWGTMLPIGVIIARYFRVYPFKFEPMWFYLHIACQLSGFLIGTAGWIIGLSLGHASRYYTFHTHRTFAILIFTFRFAILIFTFSTVQMLAFRLKPKVTDDYRKFWNMYHHFLGYGLLVIIAINIFKGISILKGGEGWKWAYVVILALLGATVLALEICTWVRFFMAKLKSNQPDYKSPKPAIENSPDMSNDPTKLKGSNKRPL